VVEHRRVWKLASTPVIYMKKKVDPAMDYAWAGSPSAPQSMARRDEGREAVWATG